MEQNKKGVVAFSGGLDTSFTVMYLAKEKGYFKCYFFLVLFLCYADLSDHIA